jgi:hypothetical protein
MNCTTQQHWGGLFAIALFASLPRVPLAQIPAPPVLAPPTTDSLCTYDRCALWLDAPGLLQGAEGQLLARRRWFRPFPLRRFVTGDSAVHYATRYEREARRGHRLGLLGGLALTAGLVLVYAHGCGVGDYDCDTSTEADVAILTLVFGGIGIDVVAQRSRDRSGRAFTRALWWHNRQFAH